MRPAGFKDVIEFHEDLIAEKNGQKFKIPIDKKSAETFLIHNVGEFMSWPENPAAFLASGTSAASCTATLWI